jgi:hypothetical protein
LRLRQRHGVVLVNKIPDQDEAVITSRGEDTTPVGRPFDTVQGGGVTLELQKCLSRLPHVEHADDVGVLGESGQEMSIVRRGYCKVNCFSNEAGE